MVFVLQQTHGVVNMGINTYNLIVVKEFISEYSDQLLKMWETGEYYKLPVIK